MTVPMGSKLTCTNSDCGCRLVVERECPHGDDFRCGCGHPLVADATDEAPMVTPGA